MTKNNIIEGDEEASYDLLDYSDPVAAAKQLKEQTNDTYVQPPSETTRTENNSSLTGTISTITTPHPPERQNFVDVTPAMTQEAVVAATATSSSPPPKVPVHNPENNSSPNGTISTITTPHSPERDNFVEVTPTMAQEALAVAATTASSSSSPSPKVLPCHNTPPPSSSSSAPPPAAAAADIAVAEDTPAYRALRKFGLLNTRYRKDNFEDIFRETDLTPRSSHFDNLTKRMQWGVYWTPGCGFIVYNLFNTEITIPPRHICRFVDNDDNYLFAKPGVHNVRDPFLKQVGYPVDVTTAGDDDDDAAIEHGNRTVVTVPQGKLGYASDRGEAVLLPPGLHSWTSESLRFVRMYDLDRSVVQMGPYTVLTVDDGYAAVTRNNGKRVILPGGETHLLTHQKHRFEKFIPLTIQTDDLENVKAASADNVVVSVDAAVVWRIVDVRTAATMAADTATGESGARDKVGDGISRLRRDVLKQAVASLAGFIGGVNYSDSFRVAAAAPRRMETTRAHPVAEKEEGEEEETTGYDAVPSPPHKTAEENPMFDTQSLSRAVKRANAITSHFGVEIISLHILSATPVVVDVLTTSRAATAVASSSSSRAEVTTTTIENDAAATASLSRAAVAVTIAAEALLVAAREAQQGEGRRGS
eukprot:CAMPEP_0172499342 /NCGR_PEP_ID=MMETSP1066-20121228/125894_1 /TAXON_ID=671091 /ORGANISM="Coscinodiscus wailesii, Strain CCMP2513" /LENGTH=644 /DNA_ID=CAMNT_0013273035 /DNA_START=43 /DNA_END=1977 /DNA_ORIENTATION=-